MEDFISTLLPSLVKKGVFGNVELVDIKCQSDADIGAQFGSSLAFVTLNVKGTKEESLQLLVKTPASLRKDSLCLFRMEFFMYEEVLPALGFDQECYPKYYYGDVSSDKPEDFVLIFDNLKYRKFNNSESRIFLDFEHISLVMRDIAKFHSFSFVLKHENPEKFEDLTKKIKQYYRTGPNNLAKPNISGKMAIKAFEEEHGEEESLEKLSKAIEYPNQLLERLSIPQEPFDVICHGDFCNNNVMYRYDKDGFPINSVFFDFQTSKYSSLVTDISFFLYLNTGEDIRQRYWDEFLKIYWESLRENVPNHINIPSFDNFLEHFSQLACYGFTICTFFLPIMMDPMPLDKIIALTDEEEIERITSPKGLETRRKIVGLISHIYHKEYLQAFLDYIEKS